MLMRAPRESGSWTWILDDVTGPGLEFALNAAARMSAVLEKHDLLELHSIEWSWRHAARRGLAGDSCLSVSPSEIARPAWPERLRSLHPQARISSILLLGSGAWVDADGERHREHVAAEPGEPTYHGCAEGHGLKAPDIIDGLGPDVSGALLG
ncbi:hypothetical protein [Streptomyces yangpuensis]|uniref:hypothetical protein n=1 Tax=Streptomyces yangpuensis TaxID=1648182 RepID=UPI00382655D0